MIYSLNGKVTSKKDDFFILETSGIGFKVCYPKISLENIKVGKEIEIFCFLYQENLDLYGFESEDDLNFFHLLNSISGIGPKIAIKIMGNLEIEKIKGMIISENQEMVSKRLCVSSKTASKIILELKDKIKKEGITKREEFSDYEEVYEALKILGYRKKDIEEALEKISDGEKTIEEKIKSALKIISNKNKK